jgi:hypothetical protein
MGNIIWVATVKKIQDPKNLYDVPVNTEFSIKAYEVLITKKWELFVNLEAEPFPVCKGNNVIRIKRISKEIDGFEIDITGKEFVAVYDIDKEVDDRREYNNGCYAADFVSLGFVDNIKNSLWGIMSLKKENQPPT